jgi:hypothetical protein
VQQSSFDTEFGLVSIVLRADAFQFFQRRRVVRPPNGGGQGIILARLALSAAHKLSAADVEREQIWTAFDHFNAEQRTPRHPQEHYRPFAEGVVQVLRKLDAIVDDLLNRHRAGARCSISRPGPSRAALVPLDHGE